MAAVPALLGIANVLFHLDHAGLAALPQANAGTLLALDLFALLVALMAGRVIPAFTANAVPAARPRKNRLVEIAAFGTLGVLAAAGTWMPGADMWLAAVAVVGAIAHGVRLWLWDPISTVREPLLWILPFSYGWLPVSLVLRALWLADAGVPAAASLHALGIGAMGGLMLGMMTRSAQAPWGTQYRSLAAGCRGTVETPRLTCWFTWRQPSRFSSPPTGRRLICLSHAPARGRIALVLADTEGTCHDRTAE